MKSILFFTFFFATVIWLSSCTYQNSKKEPLSTTNIILDQQTQMINDQIAQIEKAIDNFVKSDGRPIVIDTSKTIIRLDTLPKKEMEFATIKYRLQVIERSISNISQAKKIQTMGKGCHWERRCAYITCCRWGAPPSDPGTVKCIEQCCGAYETVLVCD